MNLTSREHSFVQELALAATRTVKFSELVPQLREVMSRSQFLSADGLGVCLTKPGRPEDYVWHVSSEIPSEPFNNYSQDLIQVDLVRQFLLGRRNQVMRDTEMLSRYEDLEFTPLYRRFVDLGTPLKRVMAVILDANEDWHGGFSLYRARPRPFSERDRALVQWFAPHLLNALHNCQVFGEKAAHLDLLEVLFALRGIGCLVLTPTGKEELRTPLATRLLETWFPSASERGTSGVPRALIEHLATLERKDGTPGFWAKPWVKEGEHGVLTVRFRWIIRPDGRKLWTLYLQETSNQGYLLPEWNKVLTPRRAQILRYVIGELSNKEIATKLGITEGTVKKLMQKIFEKLKVRSRATLIKQAREYLS